MTSGSERHAAAMDRMYRFQRHIYDATRRYYLLGRDRLVCDLKVPKGGTVLEVGCGTGRNLVKVAATYPDAEVFGFDISEEMLKSATAAATRLQRPRRIHLAQGDALNFNPQKAFGTAQFDRVYFSYTLSMIPDWEGALRHAASLVTPEGALHVADFGQCEGLPRAARHLLFAWLRQFGVAPRAALPVAFRALSDREGRDVTFESAWGGYTWFMNCSAHTRLRDPEISIAPRK
jgi:S-adenosylmethionine-diacylgycerolhomoserine-N-methlytransferase